MVITIVLIVLLTLWCGTVIFLRIKDHKKSKESGVPEGCFGCQAYKSGQCPSHKNCGGNK